MGRRLAPLLNRVLGEKIVPPSKTAYGILHENSAEVIQKGFTSNQLGRSVSPRFFSNESLINQTGSYAQRFPPLFHPLPAFEVPSCIRGNQERRETEVTELPNGLRIVSEDALGPAACVGIFVDSGSIYETDETSGISHLLERLAFKDTKNRTHLQIVGDVEATGGNVGASSSREQMVYSYDVLKAYLPQAVELLIDCIRNPIFLENVVQDQVGRVREDLGALTKDPQKCLLEALHIAGYSGALQNPLLAPTENLERLDSSAISKFYFENFTPHRMVLAASGVSHQRLLDMAEPLLYDLPQGRKIDVPVSQYIGGDYRQKEDGEMTHVALAFEAPGGWHQERDSTIITVLQTLLGGGGSFSSGGPGKGMHSRLYVRVLNKYREVQSCTAIASIYNDSGLFGIQMTTPSDFVLKAAEIAAEELLLIATPGKVSEKELLRAKNSTTSAVLMNLESRAIVTEDIGRQVLTYGCRKPVEHFLRCIDELTVDDITSMAQRVLSSPLTLACMGDVESVPEYKTIDQWFQK